jgi:hypothetical protein
MSTLPPKADIGGRNLHVRFEFTTSGMGFSDQFAWQQFWAAHVRYGSKPDVAAGKRNVRYSLATGHWSKRMPRLLCAKLGLSAMQQRERYSIISLRQSLRHLWLFEI